VRTLTQHRLSLLGFLLAGAILVAVGWLSYWQMLRLEQARELATQTLILREEIEVLLSLMKDAETGQRGFLITGDAGYLGPYESATRAVGPHLDRLRDLVAGDPVQRTRAARLQTLVADKLAELEQTVRLRRQRGYVAAARVVVTDTGKRLMDGIREVTIAMRDDESRVYTERNARLERQERTATVVNIAGLALALGLVVGATGLAIRAVRQRDAEHVARRLSEAIATASAESEARLRITVESIGDAVIATDEQGRVTLMNPVAQALTGWTESGARGRAFEEVFTIVDETTRRPVENPATKVRREGGIVGLANHTLLIARDGREIPIDDSAAPIQVPGGRLRGVVIVFRDVTGRRDLERDRAALLEAEQAARHEAEAASRAKDEFVATLSHELRTPLNSIFGWARMLQERSLDAETTRRAIEVIERSTRTQLQLIDDLLDMSRILVGKLRLEPRAVDLRAVVESATDIVRPTAEAKQVGLAVHHGDRPIVVAGDPDRLQQVLWNLLSNAIRYTPAGGRIDVSLDDDGARARVRVVDTGIGIEPDFLPHVFERFRQADASTSRTHAGLGIGLALVRHLVELHGGIVQADSRGPGAGSTFTVWLPAQDASESGVGPEAAEAGTAGAPRGLSGLHVLVVDDDPDARDLARLACAQAGARVTPAGSAAEAMRVVEAAAVDVLISDIGLPGTNGYELMAAVRAHANGRQIRAIALTAYARLEDRERALQAGFHLHVPKPIDPARLARAVALAVGRSEHAA
jgi:PAS domain S-box-containing protein